MTLFALDGIAPRLPACGSAWIAPNATLIGDVRIAPGVSIWFGAVIRADNGAIEIGADTNVQDGALLHSDPDAPLRIGAGVTIGHGAIIHGCRIEDGALIGMGATLLNRARIGARALVGAGALVPEGRAFPPETLILGAPARAVRPLDPEALAGLARSARTYADKARRYAAGLRPAEPRRSEDAPRPEGLA
ncbi:gamma carbonic anhydrase family protein [Sphingomonas morindae]|uniref:Gamma carbonic anhydrase family protein n=1 Tax=Sphingomonas morindae TaxID=1541170 RepID=A0ABY4XBN9_9SPHN|nr:gamma carbonic anhydrase family protein [Sphingomonas morindae]USI74120.1 gamma carbonic anhydrase family protein [Sphingomonas morindae]